MRSSQTSPLRIILLGFALLSAVPALAQVTLPAPPVATSVAVPAASSAMDTSLTAPLLIPMPPGAKLRVEMDARSEDVLGMMKGFLKGIGETGSALIPGQPALPRSSMADLFVNGNLADILKDVNHMHFVVYELAHGTEGAKPAAFDSNAFYETAFGAEGAHRIMFADADQYKLVMVGFPERKGYAYAVSGAGFVGVSRIDGYPNLEVLSAFISRATAEVMKSQLVKDAMKKGMGADKFIGGEKLFGVDGIGKSVEKK